MRRLLAYRPKAKHALSIVALQGVVQISSVGAAVLALRILTVEEYAIYAIMIMVVSALPSVADSGISGGVSLLLGKYHGDGAKEAQIVFSARKIRRKIQAYVIGGCIAWQGCMLYGHTSAFALVAYCLVTCIVGYCSLEMSILSSVALFNGRRLPAQIGQLAGGVVRFAGVAVMGLVGVVSAAWAVVSLAAAPVIGLILTRRAVVVLGEAKENEEFTHVIWKNVRRVMPSTVYNVLQGQLAVTLLALAGVAANVASISAVTRFGVLYQLLTTAFNFWGPVEFAKTPGGDRALLAKSFQRTFFPVATVFAFITLMIVLLADKLVLILGAKYLDLGWALRLFALGACVNGLGGALWALLSCRGYTKYASLTIFLNIVAQCLCYLFLAASTIVGVLVITTVLGVVHFISNSIQMFLALREEGKCAIQS